ncbi:hypothetical protein, conserved [Babesia bigemina]|uniref:Ribosome recycling factor domain-containing protein n=1 Tax=Babesia bigemina TaxID=5866 RepID=A0A061D7L3_BABBI|nr:hypothetical protein, conserved [Babesia bigemina]CDR94879.1 hypothetical protein, conserved [Babesia bigemina]|eukprot:XP_012767065.1 hypothetical protein, conserved [Babesia bigemina]
MLLRRLCLCAANRRLAGPVSRWIPALRVIEQTPVCLPSPYALTHRDHFASKAKQQKRAKTKQVARSESDDEDGESDDGDDEEYFDIDEHLDRIKEIEANALSALGDLKPVAVTSDDLEEIQINKDKLADLAQVVFKSPIVANLHVFDVKVKSKIVRELTLLRDDWSVQSDEDDLIVLRMPSPNSPQVQQRIAQQAAAVQERHHQMLQQALSKAAAKIKQVNIGNNWHKKQHDQLNAAAKGVRERIKAAVKQLTAH